MLLDSAPFVDTGRLVVICGNYREPGCSQVKMTFVSFWQYFLHSNELEILFPGLRHSEKCHKWNNSNLLNCQKWYNIFGCNIKFWQPECIFDFFQRVKCRRHERVEKSQKCTRVDKIFILHPKILYQEGS